MELQASLNRLSFQTLIVSLMMDFVIKKVRELIMDLIPGVRLKLGKLTTKPASLMTSYSTRTEQL
jgi:hypothetical protein